jgi:hypothetical protein
MTNTNGTHSAAAQPDLTIEKRGLAQMLKGGVIMDVVTPSTPDRRRGRRLRGDGAGARAGRHPRPGRRGAHERP